jgi:glycosyltransferase involved in cell wall biosynthesis
MRVAFVTHQFFPTYYTGVERLTLNLAEQLRRMGHECVVITAAEHSGGDEEPYSAGGTRVRPVWAGRIDLTRPWLQDPDVGTRLGAMLDEEESELVHVMHPMRLPQVFEEAEGRGLPVVAHIADFTYLCPRINLVRVDGTLCAGPDGGHACMTHCQVRAGAERFAWARELLKGAAAVVSPCRSTIEFFEGEGFDTSEWHHIPWGVDYSVHPRRLPAPDHEGLVVGFIGTLLPHKGVHVLIKAMRLLEGRNIKLVIYGDSFHASGYERELRHLAAGDDRILFKGHYRHEDFQEILAPLDLVAIPSLWHENLPTTGLNAVAAGVPLVASEVAGLVELIDDYDCGLLFPAGDASALANLIHRLLEDRELLSKRRTRMRFPPSTEEEAWRIERIYGLGADQRDRVELKQPHEVAGGGHEPAATGQGWGH